MSTKPQREKKRPQRQKSTKTMKPKKEGQPPTQVVQSYLPDGEDEPPARGDAGRARRRS